MIYIGGDINTDILEWMKSVEKTPGSIEYELLDISYLFTKTYFPEIDYVKLERLTDSYHYNVKNYYESIFKYKLGPEKSFAKSIITYEVKTELVGGDGEVNFCDNAPNNNLLRVKKVFIKCNYHLDGIQFLLSDGIHFLLTPWHGGNGGTLYTYEVPDDEFIQQIEINTEKYVNSITFITNKGVKSNRYGRDAGRYHLVNVEPYLVGIYGWAWDYIDRIGFISNRIKDIE